MTQKNLEQCNEPNFQPDLNIEPPSPYCADAPPSIQDVDKYPDLGWLEELNQQKTGFGSDATCDPILKGKIFGDMSATDRSTIYRYTRALRGCDEAIKKMFSTIQVKDENDKVWDVPIQFAPQEKAVAMILQSNVRKDNSLVVDRIPLPALAFHKTNEQFAPNRYIYHKAINWMRGLDGKPGFAIREQRDRDTVLGISGGIPMDLSYTLWAWTLYTEDMNQIFEQIVTKIAPMGYIRVRGVPWEVTVKLDSISSATDTTAEDQKLGVHKMQFDFTVATWIPQAITRKKAVLKTRIELVEGVDENHINKVLARLEEAVKALEE